MQTPLSPLPLPSSFPFILLKLGSSVLLHFLTVSRALPFFLRDEVGMALFPLLGCSLFSLSCCNARLLFICLFPLFPPFRRDAAAVLVVKINVPLETCYALYAAVRSSQRERNGGGTIVRPRGWREWGVPPHSTLSSHFLSRSYFLFSTQKKEERALKYGYKREERVLAHKYGPWDDSVDLGNVFWRRA